ncbi:30S ribosomal protein S16 [Corynebacterium sp. MSK006]|uniref:30S ribosomal protein S16 n=1 Tax=Corynebacterium sp. MSK006 TaxID=3050187 RepID=UPI00254D68C1|nr:30S ribosomal protein S16 [Corynebacterium sp. MSK006]MDK8894114.1 30S ribosomal protein S16 [Corynebacterium sp. MSK006]
MAVKLKLQRIGKLRTPHYRIIVADSRSKRGGKAIENLGIYQPKVEPSYIRLDSERVQYWLGVGAQPTEPVLAILKVTGDWQKFKGLPGAEGTYKEPEAKPSKLDLFNAALSEANNGPSAEEVLEAKRKEREAAEAKAAAEKEAEEKAAAEAAKAEEEAAEASESEESTEEAEEKSE